MVGVQKPMSAAVNKTCVGTKTLFAVLQVTSYVRVCAPVPLDDAVKESSSPFTP